MTVDEESNYKPPKKLKNWQLFETVLSLPTMKITSEQKMWRYQDFPAVAIDVASGGKVSRKSQAALAQKYLCICGTSVSLERLLAEDILLMHIVTLDHVNT